MMQDIALFSGTRLEPGTLYGALTRLEQCGWIVPLASEERHRLYRLTKEGAGVLQVQLAELQRVVTIGLLRRGGTQPDSRASARPAKERQWPPAWGRGGRTSADVVRSTLGITWQQHRVSLLLRGLVLALPVAYLALSGWVMYAAAEQMTGGAGIMRCLHGQGAAARCYAARYACPHASHARLASARIKNACSCNFMKPSVHLCIDGGPPTLSRYVLYGGDAVMK